MSGLYSTEIDFLLSRMLGDEPLYMSKSVQVLGVFARNELPEVKKERRPVALILNIDPRSKAGQHWFALFNPKDRSIKVFDLFGLHLFY